MRFGHLLPVLAILIITTYSCKTSRNQKTQPVPHVQLDTVTVVPKDVRNYRAAATRLVDLVHTRLEVSFDWQKQYMYGKANIYMLPHFFPQSAVTLDAKGMDIKKVALVQGSDLTDLKYDYDSLQLKITLPREFAKNDTIQLFIDYVAKPNELKEGGSAAISSDKGLYFINPLGKEPGKPRQLWTQGETESNSCWFPTIDKPDQGMTEEILMTVEDSFVTLSNGLLVSSQKNADGTRTDHWKQSLPHAPYLVMMAAGKYSIIRESWNGKPVEYYVEEKYAPYAKDIFGNTPEMIGFFSNVLGVKYPWEKYDQVVARDYVSGAMENTTANLYFAEIQRTARELKDRNYEYVISHELFHQWFGDLLTCESWSNLTLNEGFANYGEYLWIDHKYGHNEAEHHRKNEKDGYFAEAVINQEPLIRFYYDDRESMFDATSYNKGGLILNMLRDYVGDDAFFASLKLYLETNKFTAVEYNELRQAFEKVTGEDMNWFFNQWFLTPGHPILTVKYSYNDSSKTETVNITQSSSKDEGFIFKLPMNVDIYAGGKVKREKIVLDQKKQQFSFKSDTKPDLVNVDPGKRLLARISDNKTIDEYIFQYRNSNQYMDKQEALSYLLKRQGDEKVHTLLLDAIQDSFWSLRQQVVDEIKVEGDSLYVSKVKDALINIAKNDTRFSTATAAVKALADLRNKALIPVFLNLVQVDRSYIVTAAALQGLFELDTVAAQTNAEAFAKVYNSDVATEVSKIFASQANINYQSYFENAIEQVDGYGKYQIINNYADYLKLENEKAQRQGAKTFEVYARYGEPWYLRYAAAKSINTVIKSLDDNITKLKTNTNGTSTADADSLQKFQDELKATLDDIKKNEKNKSLITRYKTMK